MVIFAQRHLPAQPSCARAAMARRKRRCTGRQPRSARFGPCVVRCHRIPQPSLHRPQLQLRRARAVLAPHVEDLHHTERVIHHEVEVQFRLLRGHPVHGAARSPSSDRRGRWSRSNALTSGIRAVSRQRRTMRRSAAIARGMTTTRIGYFMARSSARATSAGMPSAVSASSIAV